VKSIRDLLAEHPAFRDLPDSDLDLIAGCGKNVRFPLGTTVFEEGGVADTFYVLRSGRVALDTHAPGRGTMLVATLREGDVLGWSWLFPPYRWHFGAQASTDIAAIALDGACLRGKCEEDNALGYRLMKVFARISQERLQQARIQLLDLYGETEGERGVG
jgi:CRP/FNR family transcriptional regulator, cyclic AMP receptor protein